MENIEPELVLKTTPPRSQKTARARVRLSIDTPELADKVVIAVQAPAGFGKTFLLTQWRRECLSQGAVVAWLTMDAHDDGWRFVRGLTVAMALGSGRPSFARTLKRMSGRGGDEFEGLTQWLAELAELGSETVLILDEVDALAEATIRHSLAYLLHNAPANLRIVMASRKRLNLQVSDLLARGLYTAVTTSALRLTVEETIEVLSARFGARIDTDLCVRLHDVTEGWPLGLQLAIAAMEKHTSLAVAIAELLTCSGDIQRYFVDSLVARLTPEQIGFLTSIALLDRVQPSLCIALMDMPGADEMLKELCLSTPIFVESVDSDWVRIHPLAKEFLLGRFARLPVERRQALHEQAAIWLEQHEFLEQAARQYLLAGKKALAYEVIGQCLYEVMLQGQFSRVFEWVEELSLQDMLSRPRLCLAIAWTLAMSNRQAEAAALVSAIQNDPATDEAARCEADAIATAAAYFADRPDESVRLIAPWLEGVPPGSSNLQAIVANETSRLALFEGQPEKARRIFQRAPHSSFTSPLDSIRGMAEWIVGLSYLCEGRMVPAHVSLRSSLLRAEQDIGRRSPVAVMLASSLATVLYEQGDVQEAGAVLANRLDIVERLTSPHAIVLGYLASARLAAFQGQTHRVHDLLEALFILGVERDIPRFCIASLGEQIRLHAIQGRGDTCRTLWRRLDEVVPEIAREQRGLLGPELALIVSLANAYVLLAQRDWPAMFAVLDRGTVTAEHLRRGKEVVQFKLLRALALRGEGLEADTCFEEAVSLAQEYDLQRVVQDTHPDLLKWELRRRRDKPSAPVAPSPPVNPQTESTTSSVSPSRLLTPKEREVLHLLARNLSNKQIAQAMSVGDETVKWHLKNLFGKFHAGTRQHLVARASMLGILEATS